MIWILIRNRDIRSSVQLNLIIRYHHVLILSIQILLLIKYVSSVSFSFVTKDFYRSLTFFFNLRLIWGGGGGRWFFFCLCFLLFFLQIKKTIHDRKRNLQIGFCMHVVCLSLLRMTQPFVSILHWIDE